MLLAFLFSLALAGEPAPVDDEPDFVAVAERLQLTEAQRDKVSDIVFASRSEKITLKSRAELAQLELKKQLAEETLDDKAVLKAVDAVNAAEGALRRNKVQLLLDLRKELTAEQWAQLAALRKERARERREE
ncbi:MAG: Spy/CpxP family protein refolding chaperone [Myxococcota bacterium]